MSKPIELINDENTCQIITRVPNNREIYESLKEELRHLYLYIIFYYKIRVSSTQ